MRKLLIDGEDGCLLSICSLASQDAGAMHVSNRSILELGVAIILRELIGSQSEESDMNRGHASTCRLPSSNKLANVLAGQFRRSAAT